MLTRWQALSRIAVLVVSVVLLAVQAPLLVTLHGLPVGYALVLAAAHVISAPLAMWRPLPAAVLSVLAVTAQMLLVMPTEVGGWPWAVAPQLLTQLLVLLVLTVVRGWQVAGTTLAAQLVVGVVLAVVGIPWHGLTSSLANVALFAGLALLVGSLGAVGERLVEIREALVRERTISAEEHARRTLVEEKSRVARELHDVIAHNMSLITVQARSAPHRVGDVGPDAEAEFGELADRAAEALNQMRSVLDVLRTEPDQSGRAPIPGPDRFPELFESARTTGQEVEVHGSAPGAGEVDDEVGATAYRIVQESLSNARRHAPGEPVRVDLVTGGGELEIRVGNRLRSPLTEPTVDGHGLVGMRERASAVEGTLEAGELTPGEYAVRARLPMRRTADSGRMEP